MAEILDQDPNKQENSKNKDQNSLKEDESNRSQIKMAIIKKLIYEESTSVIGKRLAKSFVIRGHF